MTDMDSALKDVIDSEVWSVWELGCNRIMVDEHVIETAK